MTQIHLRSVQDLDRFQLKVKMLRAQFPNFQETTVMRVAEETILDEIHKRMRDAKFSEKIINGTVIQRIDILDDKYRIWFRSEFFSPSGFDVALAREKGTRDHFIAPVDADSLSWVGEDGTRRYSKGHTVTGLPALMIIANTLREFTARLLAGVNLRTQNWLDMNLGVFV